MLSFCSKSVEQNNQHPVYGKTLRISCLASLEHLDPHKLFFRTDRTVASIFYETLLQFSHEKTDSVTPCLAEKWETNGIKLRFYLRNDVYFHEDPCFDKPRQLNVDDVIYSFERIARSGNETVAYLRDKVVGFEAFLNWESDSISGLQKIDDFTFEIHLTKAFVSFTKILAIPNLAIIPKEAVEFYGENFSKHPVGTAAFRLVKWNNLKSLELVRNENYWRKDENGNQLPYLDEINITLISNNLLKETKLLNNSLDLITISELDYDRIVKNDEFNEKIIFHCENQFPTSVRFWGISMCNGSKLADNLNFRRALRGNYNHNFFDENKTKNNCFIHTMIPGEIFDVTQRTYFTENYSKYQNEKFDQMELEISTNLRSNDLEILENSAKSLGIKSNLDYRTVGYYKNIFKNHPDIFRVSFGLAYPDFEEFYSLFYSKNIGQNNVTCYNNSDYDRLFEQMLVEKDRNTRHNLYFQLEKNLYDNVPAIFFCNSLTTYCLSNKNIKGLKLRFNNHDYSEVWISDEL